MFITLRSCVKGRDTVWRGVLHTFIWLLQHMAPRERGSVTCHIPCCSNPQVLLPCTIVSLSKSRPQSVTDISKHVCTIHFILNTHAKPTYITCHTCIDFCFLSCIKPPLMSAACLCRRAAISKLNSILWDRDMTSKTKTHIYHAIVKSTITYAAETWCLKAETTAKLNSTEMDFWRRSARISR